MRASHRFLLAAMCALATNVAAASSIAVEYYHGGYGHYFVTASPREIAELDAGAFPGWSRTGESFGVSEIGADGAANVCRFWSGQAFTPRSSHFYTPFDWECAIVKGNRDWVFEGEVFALKPADAAGGCVADAVPLYRLYNNGQTGAPNHRYTTNLAIRSTMLAQGWIAEGAGLGVIGCTPLPVQEETITGRVFDGAIEKALVCLDLNRNGRCDESEAQAYSDAAGVYQLTASSNSTAPLVAEVIAGVSFRMSSPSRTYATDITPFSTLVQLTGQSNYLLAEDLVRGLLGVPPKFDVKPTAPPAAGSLGQMVMSAIVTALKSHGLAFDPTAPDALASVVAAFPAALTDMPQLRIATKNGAAIDSKEDYVDATYSLTNPVASVPTVSLNGKIRGRGHSTWGQPKNPYKVQFSNDASYARITDVLGMKKQRNWALLADYFDRSLIRNKLALSLGSSSVFSDGLKWTPSGQHVEVYLNDDYIGVYLLTEDIRIDPARLNIKKMSSNPTVNDVDGGYIVEVDFRLDCYKGPGLDLQLVTASGVPFCVDTPDEEAITPSQLAYIKSLLVEVENDLSGPDPFASIDPASFVDWYLIQELFRNNDAAFISSDFMWKDTQAAANPRDRLLNMGPLWDFDRSAGNVNYLGNWETQGCWVSKPYQANWFSKLFEDRGFVGFTLSRWKQKRQALEVFINVSIGTYERRLSVAQQRNFDRWPIFDVPLTNYYVFANHAEEVAFVRQFLNERMEWLDKAYASPAAFGAMCK